MGKVIGWWSGGITSAVACKLAILRYGLDSCRIIMIDTKNEHEDTYRFKVDCSKWYGKEIEVISSERYPDIKSVWYRNLSLNISHGAVCSDRLKREVREKWQKKNIYTHQVFGFEYNKKEMNRAKSMELNHPKTHPIFPLIEARMTKEDCIKYVIDAGIKIPEAYNLGFNNNNCLNTGCVQGGIGYWKKMQRDFPDKFLAMAKVEHDLTNSKGSPVTMLKDQSKEAKLSGNELVFLIKHPNYPNLKCLDDMKDRKVKPLFECNGFCGINDLNKINDTQNQINYSVDL